MVRSFFSRLFSRRAARPIRSQPRKPRRLFFEQLEDRITPTIGLGSLAAPVGSLPLTTGTTGAAHWSVQHGDTITAQIVGATDAVVETTGGDLNDGDLNGDGFLNDVKVQIQNSTLGNQTVNGTLSGSTITFTWTAYANFGDEACNTSSEVFYFANPNGDSPPPPDFVASNNDIIFDGVDNGTPNAAAGFEILCPETTTEVFTTTLVTTSSADDSTPGLILLSDSADLEGDGSGPTSGTITFTLHAPDTSIVYTETVLVTGYGDYSTSGVGDSLTDSNVANQAGLWSWTATFSGGTDGSGNTYTGSSDDGTSTAEQITICTKTTGGVSLGYWSGKTHQAEITSDFLGTLNSLHLRDAAGNDTSFANAGAFQKWLAGTGKTGNMAYILSVQLAAAQLNVLSGKVDGTAYVDINLLTQKLGSFTTATLISTLMGGTDGLGANAPTIVAGSLVNINDLILAAEAALTIDTSGSLQVTSGSSTLGHYEEALKIVLENINLNQSIILDVC